MSVLHLMASLQVKLKILIQLIVFMAAAALLCNLSIAQAQVALDCSRLLGSSQSGELFSIDINTGSAIFIGSMPAGLATEIEYDILTDTLYAEETDGGQNLHTIDPTTGASLGTVTHDFGALNGLEFVGSTLYGTFITGPGFPSDLVIVDTSTGNLTTIGSTGFGPISGLAYDDTTGIMYGITAGGTPADLVTIDLSTGAASVVGPTGLDRIGSIEFGPDGNLYGGVTDIGSSLPTYLVRIDPATGAATPVGATGFSISGLTSCLQCTLNLNLSSTNGTLNLDFEVGTQEPANWNAWLTSQDDIDRILFVELPVIDPPISFPLSLPFFPQLGTVGVLTTLTTPDKGIVCSDFETVNTGIAEDALSLQSDTGTFEAQTQNLQKELESQIQEKLLKHNVK